MLNALSQVTGNGLTDATGVPIAWLIVSVVFTASCAGTVVLWLTSRLNAITSSIEANRMATTAVHEKLANKMDLFQERADRSVSKNELRVVMFRIERENRERGFMLPVQLFGEEIHDDHG